MQKFKEYAMKMDEGLLGWGKPKTPPVPAKKPFVPPLPGNANVTNKQDQSHLKLQPIQQQDQSHLNLQPTQQQQQPQDPFVNSANTVKSSAEQINKALKEMDKLVNNPYFKKQVANVNDQLKNFWKSFAELYRMKQHLK